MNIEEGTKNRNELGRWRFQPFNESFGNRIRSVPNDQSENKFELSKFLEIVLLDVYHSF